MKIKKEYIILFAIIVGAGLYLYFHDSDRLNYTLPELSPISRADIDRIDISLPQDEAEAKSLVLEKKEGQWRIMPENFRADETQVQTMLTAGIDLSLTTLVSTSKDYIRYGIMPKEAIAVRFSDKDGKVLRRFELGKKTTTNNHTFIKLDDDPNVYHAIGRLPKDFDKTVAKLRDKAVLSFDRQDIDKIAITQNNTTFVLEKRPPAPEDNESTAAVVGDAAPKATTPEADKPEATTPAKKPSVWIWAQGEDAQSKDAPSKNANDDEINDFLLDLSSLNCTAFLPEEEAADLNDPSLYTPIYSVTLTGADTEHRLTLFTNNNESDNSEEDVKGVSSDEKSPFVLAKTRAENIMKNKADFIAGEPAP